MKNTIWEQCIREKRCIKVGWPINDEFCLSISACLRIVESTGTLTLEVDAFGRTFSYALTNACHVFYELGYARFKICVSPNGNDSVRIVLEGCLGVKVDGVELEECWTLFAAYPKWVAAKGVTKEELLSLGISSDAIHNYSTSATQDDVLYLSLERDMSESDITDALRQPVK